MVRSAFKIENKYAEQERDVRKFWRNGQIRLAVFGVENQTNEDADLIFRNAGYDGAEYRDQVRRRREIRRSNARKVKEVSEGENADIEPVPDFYPVVTLVLFFGHSRWKGSLHLKDHMSIPNGLDPFVQDYAINLFEISFLTDEQVERFQSDFRFVAEYFVAERRRTEGKEAKFTVTLDHLKHVEEFVELMNALTNSTQFSELPDMIKEKGGDNTLTILFDEAEARGEARGEERGNEKRLLQDIKNVMVSFKVTASQAMDSLKVPASEQERYERMLQSLSV